MQYHGIASYKFEYQLSTGGDWQTALDTTASTANSYEYTYGSLTGGKSYNLRVTVTDRAGNSSTGTNTGTTKKLEKNPGGVIEDIVVDNVTYPGQNSSIDFSRSGAILPITCETRSCQYDLMSEYKVKRLTYTPLPDPVWVLICEDKDNYFASTLGTQITNIDKHPYNSKRLVGTLDGICEYCYRFDIDGAFVRNLKYR